MSIATENALTDGVATWNDVQVSNPWMPYAGFARRISYNVGETVEFSILHGGATTVDIYRAGWYGGAGFRKVASVANTVTTQPNALVIPDSNGATTATNWSVTATWDIPSNATSGIYLAIVIGPQGRYMITFVVRDDAQVADVIYKTSDATWGAAYNYYGSDAVQNGKNVYGSGTGVGNILDRALCVDYHRPVNTRMTVAQTFWMACEMPLIRWIERNGFNVKYISCVDLDQQGAAILNNKCEVFLSSGHDEYWSRNMYEAIEEWRDTHAGRSIFMSGNEVFWKTRYVYDGDRATMWCYKDTMPGPTGISHAAGAPLDPVEWTGTWKDTRWSGRKPEWLLTGTDFRMNGIHDYDATIVSNPYGGHRVWGGTSLQDGAITLQQVIGFEADTVRPTQPTESVKLLASYLRNVDGAYADDNGQNYTGNGSITWGIVSQRYASGGLTVGFGTCQWAWALDGTHDRGAGTTPSSDAQQFTLNLLADLGASPETPQADLTVPAPLASLDAYGATPGSDPDPDPDPDPPTGTYWIARDYTGTILAPQMLIGGELLPASPTM